MNNHVAITQSRLPMPENLPEIDQGKWRVLCESIFPSARSAAAVMLALDYCKARKLDIMKKPVNIVPMWSSEQKKYVETVWPGINSVQIDAARSNSWAGMDEPKWGKDVTRRFKGLLKDNAGETEITLTFPESCTVTVYRIVQGVKYAFSEPVYWTECYATQGKTELPNAMWTKRPRGQFLKVAKAFSLRAAFPEDADYTAEEMEGRIIEEVEGNNGIVIDNKPTAKEAFGSVKAMKKAYDDVIAEINETGSDEELDAVFVKNKVNIAQLHSVEPEYYNKIIMTGTQRRETIGMVNKQAEELAENTFTDEEVQEGTERAEKQVIPTFLAKRGNETTV